LLLHCPFYRRRCWTMERTDTMLQRARSMDTSTPVSLTGQAIMLVDACVRACPSPLHILSADQVRADRSNSHPIEEATAASRDQ
jgi:hypothetical protein